MSENIPEKEGGELRTGVQCLGSYESRVCPVVFNYAGTQLAKPTAEQLGVLHRVRALKSEVAAINGTEPPEGASKKEKHDWALKGWTLFTDRLRQAGLYRYPDNDPEYHGGSIQPQAESRPGDADQREADLIGAELDALMSEVDAMPAPSPSAGREETEPFFLDYEQCRALPPMTWLFKHLLPSQGFGIIYGNSGSAKTFLAMDMLWHLAQGLDWFGFKCKAPKDVPIRYLCLEGGGGFRLRMQCMKQVKGAWPDNFKIRFKPFHVKKQANDETDHLSELLAHLPQGGVTVIDTMAQAAIGLDENTSEMGEVVSAAQKIADKTNGFSLVVAHTGKDELRGIRGWSGIKGALDLSIFVHRCDDTPDSLRTWKADKVKDDEETGLFSFRLARHELYERDEDGDAQYSCIIEQTEDCDGTQKERPKRKHTDAQKLFLAWFREVQKKLELSGRPIPESDFREHYMRHAPGQDAHSRRTTYSRTKKELVQRGDLLVDNDAETIELAEDAESRKLFSTLISPQGESVDD